MLPISDFNYKLPRPERPRYSPSSLHERAVLGSMYSRSRIHPRIKSSWFSASEYKIENIQKTDFFGKVKLKILIVFALILSSLFGAQIVIAGGLTSDGKKLHEINQEALQLQSENLYLKSQIAQISSLTNLSQKADTLGFNKPSIVLDP